MKTPPPPLSARSEHRLNLWLNHMRRRANADGIWVSSKRSRAGLPNSKHMSDVRRHHLLGRMVEEGTVERVGKGKYKVTAELNPDLIQVRECE